jgi:zinc/manganese transport system substrate-binding protein
MKALVVVATVALVAAGLVPPAAAAADGSKIAVVAAENFYGDVAQQIGGDRVSVFSILSNPDQDPHLFETTPATVRQVAAAQVVIYNGADYDPWMEKLLAVTRRTGRAAIVAADVVHKKAGDNPHLWYDPPTMPAVAMALAAALSSADPAHKNQYMTRLKAFLASLAPLNAKLDAIRDKYAGAPVTATEPVFGYMAAALGLKMHDEDFQRAVMNDTEPSPGEFAAIEDELKSRKVRLLFYNIQASDNLVERLVGLARASHVPVVGVTETAPAGQPYQTWMMNELGATEKALAGPSS